MIELVPCLNNTQYFPFQKKKKIQATQRGGKYEHCDGGGPRKLRTGGYALHQLQGQWTPSEGFC